STGIAATGVPAQMSGNWSTYTAMYTGLVTDLSKSVGIRLSSPGVQGDWDNVLLSDSTSGPPTVPEPVSMLLLGSGLVGLAMFRKLSKSLTAKHSAGAREVGD